MDTPQYTNILNAIQKNGLSSSDRMENYNILEKLNSQGIKLSDVLKRAEQGESRAEDPELFSLMESAVKDDPDVIASKKKLTDARTLVLARLCYQQPEYRTAMDEYRTVVSKAYRQLAVVRDGVQEIEISKSANIF